MHCNQNYKHLQIRRGNAQRFRAANPVLQSGEIAYGNVPGMKFNIVKIGDGVTPWNDLPCLPFNDPVPHTTAPPVCSNDNFLSLQGGYFDLSFRGTPIGNNGSLENANYTIPPSSYQFDYEGLAQDSPFVLANYGSKINPLGEDDFSVSFSFYLTNKNGRHSQYGETFPLFTIGDNFNTNSLGEGELSVNLLKTGDNDSSISATFLSFQSDLLKESGISTEILPSAWYDFTLERANNLFTIKIEDETLISYSHTMSGIDLGKDLSSNNFLIGNAYPSGNFNPQFSGILIDNFQATKTCPREYYCVQELPPTTTPPPSFDDCFFALHSMWIGQSQLYSPDYCLQETTTMICNDTTDGNSSWILTEPGSWTYAGNNNNGGLDSPEALQGHMMMASLDSVFLPAGMSMHIFDGPDNTHTEMVRFVGPILVWDRGYSGANITFDQAAIHTILSNQDSSLGGKWGDYVPANRIFDQDNLPSDCFINFPSNLLLSSFYSQAGTTTETSHTLELRCVNSTTTTTTTTPSPEGCGFVALGSLTVGILRNGIVHTPDNCGDHVHGCNQPVVEATWKFTSDTNITFNGEEPISSHGSLGNTDLGSIILCSLDCAFATEGSSFHIFDDNDVEIARFTGPCLILGQHLKQLYTGEDVQSTLSNQPASIGGNWGDYITNDRVFFDEELPTTQGEIFLNLPAAVTNLDRPFTRMYQLASATQVHRFEIRTTCTTTTTAAPTTTTPPPNDCGFVSLGSNLVGSLATIITFTNPEIDGINAQTPDTCSLLANISCNEPVRECNWRFTSNTSMTFNGDRSSDSGNGDTNAGGDLGSTILSSVDSIFVIEGSSFHIFDHNEIELARFTGPCLILQQKIHYKDERILDDSNPSLGGEDIQGNLSTRPASIGGNWGDYITNDRVFFTGDNHPNSIPNTSEIFYNIPVGLNRLHTIANSNEIHRFEIRTSCCTYDENVGPQRFQVFESNLTPPSGLIFTPDGTKYKYGVVQFVGNNQSVTDNSNVPAYTNNTGKFILYDGNQIGTSFVVGDKIKLDPTYWANSSPIMPEYTYKITDIMSPGTDLDIFKNDATFSNSQVLFLECDDI